MWGSDELELLDAINYLISKNKADRRRGKRHLLKQKSGMLSREILWKLMNIHLGDDLINREALNDIEKVFMYHRRQIPDFGDVCQISTGKKFHRIVDMTFKKYRLLTTPDKKKVAVWVRDGAKRKTQKIK